MQDTNNKNKPHQPFTDDEGFEKNEFETELLCVGDKVSTWSMYFAWLSNRKVHDQGGKETTAQNLYAKYCFLIFLILEFIFLPQQEKQT